MSRPTDFGRLLDAERGEAALVVRCAEDIIPRPIRWLWRRRLPLGRYIELVGYPGIGKTALVMNVIARLTTDGRWPDGDQGEATDVLIAAAEDEADDVLVPRLIAAGADLSRVHFIDGIHRSDADELAELDLSKVLDFAAVVRLFEQTKAGLGFVDALDDVLGAKYDGKGQTETRRALAPMRRLARQTGAAILGLRHPTKRVALGPALNAGNGSIAYGGVARGSLLVTIDPDDPDRRLLLATKSNVSQLADTLAFRLESQDDDDDDPPLVVWDVKSDPRTADEVLAMLRSQEQAGAGDGGHDAVTWLGSMLEDGVSDQRAILDAARAAGYGKSSIYRAADKLRVERRASGFGAAKRSLWNLPSRSNLPTGNNGKIGDGGKIEPGVEPVGGDDPDEVARAAMREDGA
jgi:hypothetical protein